MLQFILCCILNVRPLVDCTGTASILVFFFFLLDIKCVAALCVYYDDSLRSPCLQHRSISQYNVTLPLYCDTYCMARFLPIQTYFTIIVTVIIIKKKVKMFRVNKPVQPRALGCFGSLSSLLLRCFQPQHTGVFSKIISTVQDELMVCNKIQIYHSNVH